MLGIGLGLLAVLVVVYVRLAFKLFYATYASTHAIELEILASLGIHEQEHVTLIHDVKTESTEMEMTIEQKAMHHEMIGLLEARLAKIRIAIRHRLHWRQRHVKYVLTRGVWIYVTEVLRSYFSK
jgi:hypothetical protein